MPSVTKQREEQLRRKPYSHMKANIRHFKRYYPYYLMITPGLFLMFLFKVVPLYGITVAFKDYNIFRSIGDSPWVGFMWFKMLFKSPDFVLVLRNSLTISLLELIFVMPAPMLLALLLNELRSKWFKRFTQSIVYIPHFLSWVIVGGLVIRMLSPQTGVVRYIFEWFNIQPTMLLLQEKWFYPILISGELWKSIGWGTILYLAAMAGIDEEQYEAATIDGANRFHRMIYITLPGLVFVMLLNLIMTMGSILDVGFEKVFILMSSPVMRVADVFSTFNYRVGLEQQRFSFSVALGLFQSVVGFTLVLGCNSLVKKIRKDSIF
jgi:putative aldouronate transport system permease protein